VSRRQQPIDPHRKAEALALAEEHGSAEASRRTGISADTIRVWRHKLVKENQPQEVADLERLERLAENARKDAEEALWTSPGGTPIRRLR
jgi:hypothetical protein